MQRAKEKYAKESDEKIGFAIRGSGISLNYALIELYPRIPEQILAIKCSLSH